MAFLVKGQESCELKIQNIFLNTLTALESPMLQTSVADMVSPY